MVSNKQLLDTKYHRDKVDVFRSTKPYQVTGKSDTDKSFIIAWYFWQTSHRKRKKEKTN